MLDILLRAAVLAAALLSAAASPAGAHAALVAAEPADGSRSATAPAAATLTFNEPVSPLALKLLGPGGEAVALEADAAVGDGRIRVALPPGGAGGYLLSWRVVSEDGHPVAGTVGFSVGSDAGATAGPAAPRDATAGVDPASPTGAGLWASRMLVYLGLLFGVGGTAFRLLVQRTDGPAGWTTGFLAAGIAGAAAHVGFQGCDLACAGLAALADPAIWRSGAASPTGTAAAVAAAAMALALSAPRLGGRRGAGAAVLAFAAGAGSFALAGHAATSAGWESRLAVLAHAGAAMAWIGALPPLAGMLASGGIDARAALRRFSALILPTIGLLAAAGLWLSWKQGLTADAALGTGYGRLWLAKLAGVAVLLAMAAVNRIRFTPAFLSAGGGGRAFARVVGAEALVAVLLLGAVAGWRFTPPPRALATAAAAPAVRPLPGPTVHIHTKQGMTLVTFRGREPGANAAEIALLKPEGGKLAAQEVRIELSNPAAGVEVSSRPAVKTADGLWSADGLVLPAAGTWTVTVVALVSDFDQLRLTGSVAIGAR